MKLRCRPEDFVVDEINDFKVSDKGRYKLFLLEKIGKEAFELIDFISRHNKIPYDAFGIAGLKDRHAVTKQYMTLESKYDLKDLSGEGYSLNFLGFVDKPIKIGDLKGNRFKIVVRDIAKGEIQSVISKSSNVEVPNYYDSQRFRSVTKKQFVAKYLIKKDYENAVKLYLTSYSKTEPRIVKEDKRAILLNWGKKIELKTKSLKDILDVYHNTKSWLKAYQKIPASVRELLVAAYQSYLWNECVKQLLMKYVDKKALYSVEYSVGTLLFFRRKISNMPSTFQTISDLMKPAKHEVEILNKVLAKEGFQLKDFDIRHSSNFYKTHERDVIITPNNLKVSKPLNDELYKNRYKFIVDFELPKGSYATVVIKRLFNK